MPQNVTRLLVIRHGETAWNREARIQGHIDIPLNETGQWQAQRLGCSLADAGLHALYSSDLRRAHDTAKAVAETTGLPVMLDAGLRERHFGRLEGMTPDEVSAQWPEEARRWREREPSYGPEGGETLEGFNARCVQTLTNLAGRHPGQTIAVVAHGGVLDCFYRAANRLPIEMLRTWKISNTSVNRLLYSPEGFSMLAWADDSHLTQEGEGSLDEAADGQQAQHGHHARRA
jgi:probable phosphoglycerate mutase